MSNIFIDRTTAVLTAVLDGTATRQTALAANIANAETPGYHRRDVDFATQLSAQVERPDADPDDVIAALQRIPLDQIEDATSPMKPDGNSVNMEHEMVELARNSLAYESSTHLLKLKFRTLMNAIHEGRR